MLLVIACQLKHTNTDEGGTKVNKTKFGKLYNRYHCKWIGVALTKQVILGKVINHTCNDSTHSSTYSLINR